MQMAPSTQQRINDAVEQALKDYKAKVREVALEVQQEEGWCQEGLTAALEKLGIEAPKGELVEFTLVRTFTIRARRAELGADGSTSTEFICDSLNGWDNEPTLDGDWSEEDFDILGFMDNVTWAHLVIED